MFKKKPPIDTTAVDKAIAECYTNLAGYTAESKEHAKTVKQIAELEKIKAIATKRPAMLFTPDALLTAGASLLGILLILNYERANAVTTKAIGFVSKPKL